jgi:phospholipase A-2-activating protein
VWTRDGEQILELHGHTNFIYSLCVLPTGEIVSSGEDRSIKVWNHGECIQTITLPAISIWSVRVQPNGDIVCGSSDSDVRVFTRDKTRFASDSDLREFDEKVAGSAIPQESLGDINKEKLPGLEALKNKGITVVRCVNDQVRKTDKLSWLRMVDLLKRINGLGR